VTMWVILAVISVVIVALFAWALPAWAAGRVVGAMEARGDTVANFRGRRVSLGLGLVWLVWAIGVAAAWNLVGFGTYVFRVGTSSAEGAPPEWLTALGNAPLATVVAAVPFLLVVGALAFGLADDVWGGGADKGFKGHVRALSQGRLTTGMLKMLGIGALAFVSATGIAGSIGNTDSTVGASTGWTSAGYITLAWVLATAVIALSANLVNLTDLRPGRALKVYIPLAVAGAGVCSWGFYRVLFQRAVESAAAEAVNGAAAATPGLPVGAQVWVWLAGVVVCMLVLVLGPVFAVWRYDLGERAMLGDAGANAMGAFAGYLLARSAPLWLLGALALVLLALNLVSEGVSFSSVIERVPFLAWIDGLGRLPAETARDGAESGIVEDDGARAGGPAAEDDDARRDDVS
jgi:hypothetical protein